MIPSIFDPLGILTPSILQMLVSETLLQKSIIQMLWAEKIGWDDWIIY